MAEEERMNLDIEPTWLRSRPDDGEDEEPAANSAKEGVKDGAEDTTALEDTLEPSENGATEKDPEDAQGGVKQDDTVVKPAEEDAPAEGQPEQQMHSHLLTSYPL